MGLVQSLLRKFKQDKAVAATAAADAERTELAVYVDAEIDGRELTPTEAAGFVACLERESLDEVTFASAVAAKRELLAAESEVAACVAAGIELREVVAVHQQDLEARKAEDARRAKVDMEYNAAFTRLSTQRNQLPDAQRRLRNALPPGEQSALAESAAGLKGTQQALNDLQEKFETAEALAEQLRPPVKPDRPLSPTNELMRQYRQQMTDYEQTLASQQEQRNALEGMRTRLFALGETLANQQAEHAALSQRLLRA